VHKLCIKCLDKRLWSNVTRKNVKTKKFWVKWNKMKGMLATGSPREFAAAAQHSSKDGNESGVSRVECLGTQNWNPNLKSKPDLKTDSAQNPSLKPKPTNTRNPIGYPKPVLYGNTVREISTSYKHIQDLYNIYMYTQEGINSK